MYTLLPSPFLLPIDLYSLIFFLFFIFVFCLFHYTIALYPLITTTTFLFWFRFDSIIFIYFCSHSFLQFFFRSSFSFLFHSFYSCLSSFFLASFLLFMILLTSIRQLYSSRSSRDRLMDARLSIRLFPTLYTVQQTHTHSELTNFKFIFNKKEK